MWRYFVSFLIIALFVTSAILYKYRKHKKVFNTLWPVFASIAVFMLIFLTLSIQFSAKKVFRQKTPSNLHENIIESE